MLNKFSPDTFFAVRSSGICSLNGNYLLEDSRQNSLAGQFESYLKVPKEKVENAIKLCWASLFNERSLISYSHANNTYLDSKMSVIIQEMITADYSAVLMTQDPLDPRNLFGIESTYGPCEALVSGKVTGDLILCDRVSGKVIECELGSKEGRIVYSSFSENNSNNYIIEPNSEEERQKFALDDYKLEKLIETGLKIERMHIPF